MFIPATIDKFETLAAAKSACDENVNCGGVTLYREFYETRQGGRGPCLLPSGEGAKSWVCERPINPPQARPGQGPDVPPSVTCWSRTRDTTTVAPEEWEYFLAYQRDRREGHSCPCGEGDKWNECGEGLGHMESGNSPSNVHGRNYWAPNPVKVIFDCKMWVAAYRHAEDQAIQGYFDHFGRSPRTTERERSERVGAQSRGEHQAGRGSSWSGALTGLQGSPGHCNSMFQPKRKGMAIAHGKPGQRNLWTVLYNYGGDMIEDDESCIPEGWLATGDRIVIAAAARSDEKQQGDGRPVLLAVAAAAVCLCAALAGALFVRHRKSRADVAPAAEYTVEMLPSMEKTEIDV